MSSSTRTIEVELAADLVTLPKLPVDTNGVPPKLQIMRSKAARFLPAVMTCCVWLYVVTYNHGQLGKDDVFTSTAEPLGTLWNEMWNNQSKYYAMSIAMVFGSMIAGSTPLGGGVVAFPIAVLVIGLKPSQGRDFTLIIQSVGMNAAAYTLGLVKPHLLDFNLIAIFTFGGIPGVLMAFSLDLPPFYVILTFQLLVLEFGVVYFYLSVLSPKRTDVATSSKMKTGSPVKAALTREEYVAYSLMALAAFVGGFFSGNTGSGSDIMLYVFGILCWNFLMPSAAYQEGVLTGSSVVAMGLISPVGTCSRALTRQIVSEVYFCWAATVWIVCWGAPLGSLFQTPGLQAYLRIVFYILAVLQFIGFAVIKIKDNLTAWVITGVLTAVLAGFLTFHHATRSSRIRADGGRVISLSMTTVLDRMLER